MYNFSYFHSNRISYKCYPYSDESTESRYWGWYYKDGTEEGYRAFPYYHPIKSFKKLYWTLSVLHWVNSKNVRKNEAISESQFIELCKHVADKDNGFSEVDVTDKKIESIAKDIFKLDKKPKNNKRYFIFKDGIGLLFSEKMKVVSSYKQSYNTDSVEFIVDSMRKINASGEVITNKKIAMDLGVSVDTVEKYMDDNAKKIKQELNGVD